MDDNKIIPTRGGKIEEINLLRAFGVLAVIAIHTSCYFTEIESFNTLLLANLWVDIFCQVAVPLFIMISGFVLAKNYRSDFSLKRFYLKRARSIIPQYVIVSAAYTIYNNQGAMKDNPLHVSFNLIIKNILNSNASFHLWFFAIIIQFYCLYPLIIKIYDYFKRKNKSVYLIAALLILQILWMEGVHTVNLGLPINFIAYLFYFGVGIYSWDHFAQLRTIEKSSTPIFLVTSLALTIGASFSIISGLRTGYHYSALPNYFLMGPELIFPILRISAFLLCFNFARSLAGRKNIIERIMNRIGDYSFGIYLIHIFFNRSLIEILKNSYALDYTDWLFYPLVFLGTSLLSYLAVRLLSYLPFSYYLIGCRAKPQKMKKV